MATVRHTNGAKLLITKSFARVPKTGTMCGSFTAVADLPRLLGDPAAAAPMPPHAYRIASTVLTFVRKDPQRHCGGDEASSETYIAGDPTGAVRVTLGRRHRPAEALEGNTFVVFDIALAVARGSIYLQTTEDTRLVRCQVDADHRVREDNDVSHDYMCAVRHKQGDTLVPSLP